VGEEMKPPAMKPLTISGFITAILLIALSIYVVEDLPAFGDENSPVNKYVKLFNVDADGLVESLNAGVLPLQIKIKIEDMGFNKEENYPTLEEGNYRIEWSEKGSFEGGRLSEGGWDILINEGEIFYNEPIRYYFIKEENRNLTVYRYNFPVRINELTEDETATINIVTAGLADYRGYDTMGEETVILTGAIGVILLLRRRGRL
jgi:multicomponent Na+:H+ antiporter subunit B